MPTGIYPTDNLTGDTPTSSSKRGFYFSPSSSCGITNPRKVSRFFFFTVVEISCPGLMAGGGATGKGKPRNTMINKIGSSR